MAHTLIQASRAAKFKERVIALPEGASIYGRSDSPRRVYLLVSGRVRLSVGDGPIIDHLLPGSLFGAKSLLPSSLSEQVATAVSPVQVVEFRRSDLVRRLRSDPRFALQIVRSLAARLDRYEQVIRDLAIEPPERRLARLLFRIAHGRTRSGWVQVPFRVTNQDLARMIGITQSRVSRLLSRFQRLGWLRRQEALSVHRGNLKLYLDEPGVSEHNSDPATTSGPATP